MADLQPFEFLGPEGVQRRVQEIQAKMASVFGKQASASQGPSFDEALKPFDVSGPGVAIKPAPAELKPLIETAAKNNNVDPALLDALVCAESSYDPSARSRAGAMGLSQLMPDTAKGLNVGDPFDPAQNLNGGAKYLRGLLDKFGQVPLALAAYNAGPAAVERFGGVPPYAETQAYVKRIMASYEARRSQ